MYMYIHFTAENEYEGKYHRAKILKDAIMYKGLGGWTSITSMMFYLPLSHIISFTTPPHL